MATLVLVLTLLGAHDELPSRFRLVAELSSGVHFGHQPDAPFAALGGSIEGAVAPLSHLRLGLSAIGVWQRGEIGGVSIVGGPDLVFPVRLGELFLGVSGGVTWSNLVFDWSAYGCLETGSTCARPLDLWPHAWGASMRVRAGFDVLVARPLVLGVAVAYQLIVSLQQLEPLHVATFNLRVGGGW